MSYIDYEAPVSRAVATALEADAVSDIVYEALVGLAVATTQVDVKLQGMASLCHPAFGALLLVSIAARAWRR